MLMGALGAGFHYIHRDGLERRERFFNGMDMDIIVHLLTQSLYCIVSYLSVFESSDVNLLHDIGSDRQT
jgi:hypothetical protein